VPVSTSSTARPVVLRLPHQIADAVDARLRGQAGLVLTQHSHEPAHLAERLAGAALNVLQVVGGAIRVVRQQLLGGARLQRDHRHAVADDVVQLARDPSTFGCHGGVRLGAGAEGAATNQEARPPRREHEEREDRRIDGCAVPV
jgi:hypothetical protein